MRMDCEILGVKSKGTKLELQMQGRQKNGADWREWCTMTLEVPNTDKAGKAMYVGRSVTLTIHGE